MFKIDDRVIMIKNDYWAKKGQTGSVGSLHGGVRVRWDNGGGYLYHNTEDLAHTEDYKKDDPNIAFMLHKRR